MPNVGDPAKMGTVAATTRPRTRQRIRGGVLLILGGLVLAAVTLYYAFNPAYGWGYAMLFTGLPAVAALGVGVWLVLRPASPRR
jgi:hypothetical protein